MRLFLMIFSRADLRIGVSRAKNCEESDSDIHFCVAPLKPSNKNRKTKKIVFDVEKLNGGNRLKRVLAKFEGRTSYV